MVNVLKLKGKIVEKGLSIGKLAKKMNMDRATLYRRINNNGDSFTIKEANQMCKELDLSNEEVTAIFFSHYVA